MTGKIAREIDNYFRMVHDVAVGHEVWTSSPGWVEYTTNNACNLRCVMCGVSDGQPLQKMSDEDATQLLDDILPNASVITPQANSEPLLANMDLLVAKCREHDVWMNLITNATIMNGEYARKIVDRLFKLSISMDSHIPEVYEAIRGRAKFDIVDKHIREIVPVLAEHRIHMAFNLVLMADNVSHLDGFVEYVADVGGAAIPAEVHVQPMEDNASGCAGRHIHEHYTREQIEEFLDRAVERAQALGIVLVVDMAEPFRRNVTPQTPAIRGITPDLLARSIQTLRAQSPHFCSMVASYMKIEPNGNVYPCCHAPRELLMGNVHERSPEEIWNGEEYRELRRRMHARDYPAACVGCNILVANPAFQEQQRRS